MGLVMDINDFFRKYDQQAEQENALKQAEQLADAANLKFAQSVMSRLEPVADQYAAYCKQRQISSEVLAEDFSLTFSLRHKDGSERVLRIRTFNENKHQIGLEFIRLDNGGYGEPSEPFQYYNSSNWRDEIYEQNVQDLIAEHRREGALLGDY